jgi:hypothetical protein
MGLYPLFLSKVRVSPDLTSPPDQDLIFSGLAMESITELIHLPELTPDDAELLLGGPGFIRQRN